MVGRFATLATVLVLVGCQTGTRPESETASLAEAKQITAEFDGTATELPPRTIFDIEVFLAGIMDRDNAFLRSAAQRADLEPPRYGGLADVFFFVDRSRAAEIVGRAEQSAGGHAPCGCSRRATRKGHALPKVVPHQHVPRPRLEGIRGRQLPQRPYCDPEGGPATSRFGTQQLDPRRVPSRARGCLQDDGVRQTVHDSHEPRLRPTSPPKRQQDSLQSLQSAPEQICRGGGAGSLERSRGSSAWTHRHRHRGMARPQNFASVMDRVRRRNTWR